MSWFPSTSRICFRVQNLLRCFRNGTVVWGSVYGVCILLQAPKPTHTALIADVQQNTNAANSKSRWRMTQETLDSREFRRKIRTTSEHFVNRSPSPRNRKQRVVWNLTGARGVTSLRRTPSNSNPHTEARPAASNLENARKRDVCRLGLLCFAAPRGKEKIMNTR